MGLGDEVTMVITDVVTQVNHETPQDHKGPHRVPIPTECVINPVLMTYDFIISNK